ncbi:low-density lipoprotein receptor-related protein 6-like [Hyposmocoma kahamanoa]|uniref:low-density lipoprotein receptor-related protein 6-like n=1 Tax=Hyposmocoma kahamanoa TaxID=1477025 RepID=UPI000E6D5EED|nr:low-density lipoprotein receptor-related protein 6-like [Hyposmocoma kahamanoa]
MSVILLNCDKSRARSNPETSQVVSGSRQSNAFVVCGAIVGCCCGAAGAWTALRRWRRGARGRRVPHSLPIAIPLTKSHADIADDRPSSGTLATDSLCSRYERYPRPTANPPPSPATAGGGGSLSLSRRRPYRHYRASNRPPPPTPASTDACESEPEPGAPPPSPAPDADPALLPF